MPTRPAAGASCPSAVLSAGGYLFASIEVSLAGRLAVAGRGPFRGTMAPSQAQSRGGPIGDFYRLGMCTARASGGKRSTKRTPYVTDQKTTKPCSGRHRIGYVNHASKPNEGLLILAKGILVLEISGLVIRYASAKYSATQ